jgi:ATP-binding cassette subfamily B protein
MPVRPAPSLARVGRAVRGSLELVHAAAPRDLRAVAALQLVSAGCLVGQLLVLRALLTVVLKVDRADGVLGRLLPELLGLLVLTATGALATGLAAERQRLMVELVRREAMQRILAVTTTVALARYETGGFNNALSRARQQALVRPTQIVAGLLGAAQGVLASAALIVTLAAIAPVLLPVLLVGVVPTLFLLRRNSTDLHQVDRSLTTTDRQRWYLEDVLSTTGGAKESRVFGLPLLLGPMQRRLADDRVEAYRRLIRRRSWRVGLTAVLSAGALVLGLTLLGALVVTGRLTAAAAGAAGLVLQQLTGALRGVTGGVGAVLENRLFLAEVDSFTQMAPTSPPPTTRPVPPDAPAELVLDHVSFCYPGTDRPVLRDVSLGIGAGKVVAVVGENGSGKTSFAKLLCGLYAPTSGSVLWGGTDATEVDEHDWRARFSVVFQDFARYELSARLNVAVGRHDQADDLAGIRAAAALSDADEFLSRLEDGYETTLSRAYAGGAELSVGQWQRLALARAFFSDAPVLVLDEPTSALDPRVEQELLHQVTTMSGSRTVVLISHRLSSVRFADQIFVLRRGELIESGDHDQLITSGGHYADLFDVQAAAYRGPALRPVPDEQET